MLETPTREALEAEAQRRGLSISQVARDALRRHLGSSPQESGYREGLMQGIGEAKEAIMSAMHKLAG